MAKCLTSCRPSQWAKKQHIAGITMTCRITVSHQVSHRCCVYSVSIRNGSQAAVPKARRASFRMRRGEGQPPLPPQPLPRRAHLAHALCGRGCARPRRSACCSGWSSCRPPRLAGEQPFLTIVFGGQPTHFVTSEAREMTAEGNSAFEVLAAVVGRTVAMCPLLFASSTKDTVRFVVPFAESVCCTIPAAVTRAKQVITMTVAVLNCAPVVAQVCANKLRIVLWIPVIESRDHVAVHIPVALRVCDGPTICEPLQGKLKMVVFFMRPMLVLRAPVRFWDPAIARHAHQPCRNAGMGAVMPCLHT
mmetsp:Transcript_45354/g.105912  ORF Transcript_45354/g.105912 Transcript_45354/m.105912 type:complete len:304 (+) Transcript_45354:142-1053(+)